jgi:sugar lactone lactonase YvrE
MDIQSKDGKLYAAENGRFRVARYDREGTVEATWGERARDGVEGFGSCCNPMNVRFGADGNLYTSEASVGRIKRYTPDGKFLGVVGTARIVPGCKHVAIGMDPKGKRFYMLDITRNQIVVMERKAEVVREF